MAQPPVGDDGPLEFDFGGRITRRFVPDADGTGRSGVLSVGRRRCASTATSWSRSRRRVRRAFFGMGSPESGSRSTWRPGGRYDVEVDYPLAPGDASAASSSAPGTSAAGDPDRAAAVAGRRRRRRGDRRHRRDWETEGEDRTTLALPGDQDELVAAVAAANPNTVVVLNTGSPVTMPWLDDVPAVLQLWFPARSSATRWPTC